MAVTVFNVWRTRRIISSALVDILYVAPREGHLIKRSLEEDMYGEKDVFFSCRKGYFYVFSSCCPLSSIESVLLHSGLSCFSLNNNLVVYIPSGKKIEELLFQLEEEYGVVKVSKYYS